MRTVLLTSVAALGFACASGARGQTPPAPPAGAMEQSAPAAPAPVATDATPQTAPAPRHHRAHHATRTADGAEPSGGWAHAPGTGESGPASASASNIDGADTHSAIAPHLPAPKVADGARADAYLRAAQAELAAHHTGAAQQALEMAETRLLDRSTPVGTGNQPDSAAAIQQLGQARTALAQGDMQAASGAIARALADADKE